MTRTNPDSDQNLLPLALACLVSFALAGVAVLVSANTQVPNYPAVQAVETEQVLNTLQNKLHADKLSLNTLAALQSLPENDAALSSNSALQPGENVSDHVINVNTFLLSTRINNDSRLAELQMQPFFGDVDVQHFVASSADAPSNTEVQVIASYASVGFPHIETNKRAASKQYKPYKQLLSFSSDESGAVVPHIKCMGLSPQRVAKRAKKYDAKIFELAVKHRVSASLVKAVVAKESCFNPTARSHVGAIGLMQLMPETAAWLKVTKPENVNQNLSAGVRYLAQLRKRFGSDELALAAYNAGPGNVERYNGIPPFAETENYVQDVMYFYRGYVATTRFVNAMNSYE